MAPRLVTKGSSWVEPAAPIKAEIVQLSAIDNQCAQVYPCGFWFFPENKDQKDVMYHYEQMKRALARLLYQQPINAGILRQNERGDFYVEIPPAPHAGARFHYQDVSNDPTFPSMQQIADAKYPVIDGYVDGFNRLRPEPFPTSSAGDPVMVCQLTKLNGGLVVFASCTHLIGDLLQPRMALCGWAEQTKLVADAVAAGQPEPPLSEPFPDILYDRSQLSPPKKREMSYKEVQKICDEWGTYFFLDPTDPVAAAERLRSTFPSPHLTPAELPNENYLREHIGSIWKLKLKDLQILQHLARQHNEKRVSTVDSIIAFIWQRFYYAKYAMGAGKDAAPTRPEFPAVVFPGDIRGRLNPPLPPMYLGAAVDLFRARVSAKDLLPQTQTPEDFSRALGIAAGAVRDANSQFDEARYMLFIEMGTSLPKHVPFLPTGPLDLLITDHTRNIGLRNADWGHGLGLTPELRQPYFGRDMPPGEITLMPRFNNGDMEVMITAERVVLQRMCDDPIFTRFAELVFLSYNVREALCPQYSASNPPVPRL